MSTPGLGLSRAFFHEVVEPLVSRVDPDLRYSAALIGPGSEVLGYDDETSTDHHWGPRVQLFVREADGRARAARLTDALAHRLPHRFRGYATNFSAPDPSDHGTQLLDPTDSGPVNHRVEIVALEAWLEEYLGLTLVIPSDAERCAAVGIDVPSPTRSITVDPIDWLTLPQQKLRSIVSGGVFRDDEGRLRALRSTLAWYPDDVWRYLLAAVWTRIGQEEHLVGRAGQAGDERGARIIASRLVRDAMRLCFLMERAYAPYPKWLGRAFAELEVAAELGPLLDEVDAADEWRSRDAALVPVWEVLARRHNRLGITKPMPENATSFFGRPFHVIALHGHAGAILETVSSPWLSPEMRRSPLGSVDLITDNTDLLEDAVFRPALRRLLGGER
ncbi:MAG: DUF4037 domain-containing protein [Spirochaetota bacterium]